MRDLRHSDLVPGGLSAYLREAHMTKLEQVARAICDYWMEHGFDPSEPSEGAARAAVEALREPSDGSALLWGAFDKAGCTGDEPLEFNAVLDAILNEKPE